MRSKQRMKTTISEVFAVVLALLFLAPFYIVLTNSFKTFAELSLNTAGLPQNPTFNNYIRAFEILEYPKAFANSLMITIASNIGLIVMSSMAAWQLVRRTTKVNNIIFALFVAAMVIPFQSVMIPLMKVIRILGVGNSKTGLIIAYFGFGTPLTVFLYHGFIKSIPMDIEEAATVDGCNPYQLFWQIIFPLLKPITVTISILNSLWIWNDFLLPSLVLTNKKATQTIPLAASNFFAQYTKQWDLALASLVLGVIPIIIFFLALQKHIIEGITAGSVKG